MKNKNKKLFTRIGFAIIVITLISYGSATLRMGHLHYFNYWGVPVFAPFAILGGIAILLLSIFRWEKINKMKKISITIIIGLLMVSTIFANTQKTMDPIFKLAEDKIKKALINIKDVVTFEYQEYHSSLLVKYKTRKFMVYGKSMTGEIAKDTHEEEGPSHEGFLLFLNLQPLGYSNPAKTPQLLQRPYWKTFINVTEIKDTDKQFYWGLSFDTRTDNNIIENIKQTITNFEKEF